MFSFVKRTLLFVCLLYLFFFINTQAAFSQSTSLVDFTKKAFKAIVQEAVTEGPVELCLAALPSLFCNIVLKPVVKVLNEEYPTWHSDKEIALNAIDNDPDINNLIRGKLSQLESQHDEILKQLRELGKNQQEMQTSLKTVLDKLDVMDAKLDEILENKETPSSPSKATELDHENAETYIDRGYIKYNIKDYKGALQDYNKAIELDPNFALAYYKRCFVKAKLDDLSGQIEDLSKAIQLDPTFVDAYMTRGIIQKNHGGYAGAIQDYSKIIELNPKSGYAYRYRGFARYRLGQKDSACRDWSKAGELGESDANSYWHKHCD